MNQNNTPKSKRRGGKRDESKITVGYTRQELYKTILSIKRKCESTYFNTENLDNVPNVLTFATDACRDASHTLSLIHI